MTARWGDPAATPLDDIAAFVAKLGTARPNRVIMTRRTFLRIARGTMTKRRWRRFRGRMKAR